MLDDLLVNRSTLELLELYLKGRRPPLMLAGPEGGGKRRLAKSLAVEILGLPNAADLTNYAFFAVVEVNAGKQAISIDQIRNIIGFLKLKTVGVQPIRRIILIADAQNMNQEAQNALLKILEEPPEDTLFILTCISPRSVLPTIASRCQQIEVKPLGLAEATSYWTVEHQSVKDIENAWRLSQGMAGLMSALLESEADHPLKTAVEAAKHYLSKTKYQRLLVLHNLTKDKEAFERFLDALGLVLSALHQSSIKKASVKQQPLLASRQLVIDLRNRLLGNCSAKLIGDKLSLQLAV